MTAARSLAARMTAAAIVTFAKVLTGLRALWHGAPQAAPTVYFANHTSHGDFVLLWAALPSDLRGHTRPVAAADYWAGSALRRFIGGQVFRALLIDRQARRDAPDPVQAMAARLQAGDSLILFPEGTRNTGDEVLLPLKSGLYHLAHSLPRGAPGAGVDPRTSSACCPRAACLPVPLACTVEFGAHAEALQPDEEPGRLPGPRTRRRCWPCVRMGMTEAGHRPVPADRPVATAATGTFGSGR
jgi:1-acyl-sn-glycerol-3-phosphate acyltransferase